MKRASLAALGLLLLLAAPLAAEADDFSSYPYSYAGEWYLGITGGVSSYGDSRHDERELEDQYAFQGTPVDAEVNDNPGAWGLGLGYRITSYVALEADYLDLGQATADVYAFPPDSFSTHQTARARGVTFDVIGTLPIADWVSLFGKIGAFDYHLGETASAYGTPVPAAANASGTNLDAGFGVQIRFNRALGLRAGFDEFPNVGNDSSGKQDLGLGYAELMVYF